MPSCVLRYCKSRYGKTTERDYSLFTFPPVNNSAREKWIQFVQTERKEENWLPSAASKLCSKHFRKEDICFGKTGRPILKKGSLPCTTGEVPKPAQSGSGRGGEGACVTCGGDVGKHGRRVLGSPAEEFIEAAIFPRELNEKTLLCSDCYDRYCFRGQKPNQNPRKSSNTKGFAQRVALSEESANVKVSTLPTCHVSAALQQIITLPNYKRVPCRSKGCVFPNCPSENLHIIPQYVKQYLLRDYKLYTPEHSRLCKEHLFSKKWGPLLNIAESDFTAQQIEDVISTLTTNVTAFNFNNIEDIPPNLLLYCTGINHRQLQNILDKIPSLKRKTKTPVLALTAYLTKLRTNDSFDRLSTLFQSTTPILEKLIKVAKDCMIKKFVQDYSRVPSPSGETGKASKVVTEDKRVLRYLQEHYYGDEAATKAAAAMRSRLEILLSTIQCQTRKDSTDSDEDILVSKARAKQRRRAKEVNANKSIEDKRKQYMVSEVGVEFENPEIAEAGVTSESSEDEEELEQARVNEEPEDEVGSVGEGDSEEQYLVYAPEPIGGVQADPLDIVPAPRLELVKSEEDPVTVKEEPGEGESQAQPTAGTSRSRPGEEGSFTVYYTRGDGNFLQGPAPKS